MKAKTMSAKELKQTYPHEPWHWRKEWHEGVIKGSAKLEAWAFGIFGGIFIGLSLPALSQLPHELSRGKYTLLVVLVFPLVGLWIWTKAWHRLRQLCRFGTLSLQLDTLPGSWGGWVAGKISIPKGARATGHYTVRLVCLHRRTTGTSKSRSTSSVELWEVKESLPAAQLRSMGLPMEIPLKFLVPRDQGKPTDFENSNDQILWQVELTMPLINQAKPLTAAFEVPVFDRGEDLAAETVPPAPTRDEEAERLSEAMVAAGVMESQESGETVWRFRQLEPKKIAWVVGLMALGCAISGWFVPVFLMEVVFLTTALVLVISIPIVVRRRSELRWGPQGITVRRHNGFAWKIWHFDPGEIADLELEKSMRSTNTQYFHLFALGRWGVDPEVPHAAEHREAGEARMAWKRAMPSGGGDAEKATQRLLETPRFKLEITAYLQGTMAAATVRDALLTKFRAL